MCTAATYRTKDFYFGRTLDYEISYGDQIVVTPRNYAFPLRNGGELKSHYAMIGMACVMQDYPLYYDAANEKGLCIAGLNFVGNAYYGKPVEGKDNLAQFELIPWLLGSCASVKEVRQLLPRLNLIDTPFMENLPVAQLHWIIADRDECITVEAVKEGLIDEVGGIREALQKLHQMIETNRENQKEIVEIYRKNDASRYY